MGRPKGSKNKEKVFVTGTEPGQETDYKKLYETLKKEDEHNRQLLAKANQDLAELDVKYKRIFKKLQSMENKLE